VFGFIKRLRAAVRPADRPHPAAPQPKASHDDERPGKSWYASSLDLHEGLEVSDADGDVTVPSPLADAAPPKR
jgi:hypothetical protein